MSEKSLTRVNLSEAVVSELGVSRNEAAKLVGSVLRHVSDALVRGESVKISKFGTFLVRGKSARMGRNPKTGVEAEISARRVLTVRFSNQVKRRVAAATDR